MTKQRNIEAGVAILNKSSIMSLMLRGARDNVRKWKKVHAHLMKYSIFLQKPNVIVYNHTEAYRSKDSETIPPMPKTIPQL